MDPDASQVKVLKTEKSEHEPLGVVVIVGSKADPPRRLTLTENLVGRVWLD